MSVLLYLKLLSLTAAERIIKSLVDFTQRSFRNAGLEDTIDATFPDKKGRFTGCHKFSKMLHN